MAISVATIGLITLALMLATTRSPLDHHSIVVAIDVSIYTVEPDRDSLNCQSADEIDKIATAHSGLIDEVCYEHIMASC